MVYNKKLCAPIKRQKSAILRKTKPLEIVHLLGGVGFEAVIFICFAISQRDKVGQSCRNLETQDSDLVSPLCTLSTKLYFYCTSQEMGILRETEVVLKKYLSSSSWDRSATVEGCCPPL